MFLSRQVDIPLLYNYVYFTDLFYKSEFLSGGYFSSAHSHRITVLGHDCAVELWGVSVST